MNFSISLHVCLFFFWCMCVCLISAYSYIYGYIHFSISLHVGCSLFFISVLAGQWTLVSSFSDSDQVKETGSLLKNTQMFNLFQTLKQSWVF